MLQLTLAVLIPMIVLYCLISYLFMWGMYQDDELKKDTDRDSLLIAPITFLFILGQIVAVHHRVNAKNLSLLKEYEERQAAEKRAKKAFIDEMKKLEDIFYSLETKKPAQPPAGNLTGLSPDDSARNAFKNFLRR